MYPNEMDLVRAPDNFSVAGNFSLQQLSVTNKQPLPMQPGTMVHPLARPHMHSSPSAMDHPVARPHLQPFPSTVVHPGARLHTQPSPSAMVHPVTRPHMRPTTKPRMQTIAKPMAQARFKPPPATKQPPVTKPQPVIKQQASFKTRLQPPPKVRESFDNVRSKLRDSLAEALALVDQAKSAQKDESKNLEVSADASATKQYPTVLPQRQAETEVPHQKDVIVHSPAPLELQSAQTAAVDVDCSNAMAIETGRHNSLPEASDRSSSNYIDLTQSVNEVPLVRNYVDEDKLEFAKMWSCDQEFNPSDIFPEEETFILKDDLLEANGLYWASDLDLEDFDISDTRDAKKPKLLEDLILPNVMSPQFMASKIEDEMFKFFGSVNKKYKEKGRSLLFNLKDRNNPELRERVMAGEIPPEKLCAMTAEELASKELSQWRIAKAEELAQMVVLPDSNVDLRRMVRKTHKGEIQVEFEQDDGASVEVAIGESSLTMLPSRTTVIEDETEEQVKIKTSEEANSDANKLVSDSLASSDSVQGVLEDDELKATELLPPIVSLDEFMESRNGDSLSDNSPGTGPEDMTCKDDLTEGTNQMEDLTGSNSIDVPSREEGVDVDTKIEKANNNIKFDDKKIDLALSVDESKVEKIWSGILQLAISSLITVVGIFKSGEKTATIEWPSLLEIKGRVRLDAFGKFLQELPQSRSRAVMVVQFFCEEGSSGSEQSKAIESYVADERPGFAEPAPGVELYVCSPGNNVSEMLSGLLPKENAEAVKNLAGGLVGIVVWRRAMFSTISPRPSHHRQQQNSRRNSSLKKQEKNTLAMVQAQAANTDAISDDDDAPPGFGHVRADRDDDDLPDFQYVKPSNYTIKQSVAYGGGLSGRADRPVELVRSLIHKYGQNNTASSPMTWDHHQGRGAVAGVETQPWNDEDDIPDWQPGREAAPQSHPGQAPAAMHSYHDNTIYNQFSLQTPLIIPHQPQLVPLQPPIQMPYYSQPASANNQTLPQTWQQVAWPTQPGHSAGAAGAQQQMMGQQYYGMPGHNKGMDWRH